VIESDKLIEVKELEIASLRAPISCNSNLWGKRTFIKCGITNIVASTPKFQQRDTNSCLSSPKLQENSLLSNNRKGKAPPVDLFNDHGDMLWKDWLPTFELAAAWNNWTEEEKLWQLAGHLRGKASQEWTLLPATDKLSFASATKCLS